MQSVLLVSMAVLCFSGAVWGGTTRLYSDGPPETRMTSRELTELWGYHMETHTVRTEDGYILNVHRVMASPVATRSRTNRTPVLFIHCLAGADEVFFIRKPDDSLVFHLVDLDFDVWLINFRGSLPSRGHVSLSAENVKYWDFSWHENGYYDLAATIDYVLNYTRQPSLVTIGYSMGSTAAVVLLSERPEYNAKVKASILMSPAVYFHHLRGMFVRIRKLVRANPAIFRSRFVIRNPFMDIKVLTPCISSAFNEGISPPCLAFLRYTGGPFSSEDFTLLTFLMRHWPQGCATRQLFHYAQILSSDGEFRKYDFGPQNNLNLYGTQIPPRYNLTNIVSPTFVFYSENDRQVHPKDLKRLASNVPGLAELYRVPDERFGHLDFIMGPKAFELLYVPVIDRVMKYR